jgi:uracil-DNA glycosylase
MALAVTAADFLPPRLNIAALRRAAQTCEGCELFANATQTVFGAGARHARIVLIGEMPGDREDIEGKPFVGPAGRLLDETLEEAGIARDDVYVTNAVKHFRWEPRGKRRLHKSPAARHIEACRPWLQAEILVIEPQVLVLLGAVAAKSLLGSDFRISKSRGKLLTTPAKYVALATHHPAAVLRSPRSEDRDRKRGELIADLKRAARELDKRRRA